MKSKIGIAGLMIPAWAIVIGGIALVAAKFKSDAYYRETGQKISTWEALSLVFIGTRVQSPPQTMSAVQTSATTPGPWADGYIFPGQ